MCSSDLAEYRQSASTPAAEVAAPAASQQVIVRFRTNVPVSRQQELLAKWQARVVRVVDRKGEYAVELPVGTAMPSAPEIEFSEPDYLFFISYEPNDPLYANYSGSTNDMQKWIYDADNLNAEAAWDKIGRAHV